MNNNAKKWVEALQSGEYKQCSHVLDDGDGGHCCLGVACRVYEEELGLEPMTILNLDGIYNEDLSAYEGVQEWLGLRDPQGGFSKYKSLASINDDSSDFDKVISIILKEPDGLFVKGGEMKILLLVASMVLSGCFESSPIDKSRMDFVCSDKGGVYEYGTLTHSHVQCRDGSWQGFNKVVIPPEFYPDKEEAVDEL